MIGSNNSSRKPSEVIRKTSQDLFSDKHDHDQETLLEKREMKWYDNLENSKNNKWIDPDDDNIEIDLSSQAKLRKIMRKNGKNKVRGGEYQNLMKEYYFDKYKAFDFFKWAAVPDEKSSGISKIGNTAGTNLNELLKTSSADLGGVTRGLMGEGVLDIKKATQSQHKDRLNCVVQTMDFNLHQKNM